MKTNALIFIFTLLLVFNQEKSLNAQKMNDELYQIENQKSDFQMIFFRALLMAPSLELEVSLTPELYFTYILGVMIYTTEMKDEYFAVPHHTFAFRQYYNLKKRREAGKNISKLSGNFASLNVFYAREFEGTPKLSTGFAWGMYRNPFSVFTFGIEVICHVYSWNLRLSVFPKIGVVF